MAINIIACNNIRLAEKLREFVLSSGDCMMKRAAFAACAGVFGDEVLGDSD